MGDVTSDSVRSSKATTFTALSIFPLTQILVDGTSEVWPAFGRPVSVVAKLKSEKQGEFADFYLAPDVAKGSEKWELFRRCHLQHCQIVRAGPTLQIWAVEEAQSESSPKTTSFGIQSGLQKANDNFYSAVEEAKSKIVRQEQVESNGDSSMALSKFEKKIEPSSAKMYFHYYGQLLHQQNMMQDYVRTAGAKHVYAVEASAMAEYARKLVAGNHPLGQRITVIHGKVEEIELPEKADILISEPMGTLLVNERMLESYIIARDRFLVPNGKMFPSRGRIHMAPFSDEYLYGEIANKALFWHQQSYYGVDLTPLRDTAFHGYFSQPVVDAFDPRLLVAQATVHNIDFNTAKEEDLYEIDVALEFQSAVAARVHGLACWFDVLFDGSTVQRWLTTAPGFPTTHWYQLRCVLSQPLYVLAGQPITGRLHLIAHSSQSYTIHLTMNASTWGPGVGQVGVLQTSTAKLDLKEPYYRMTQSPAYAWSQQEQQAPQQVEGIPPQGVVPVPPQQHLPEASSQALLQNQQFTVSTVAQRPQQMPELNYWATHNSSHTRVQPFISEWNS